MVKAFVLALLLFWIFVCIRPSHQQETDLLVNELTVTALGRVALIGDLYDARRDSFVGLSLLQTKLPPQFVDSTQNRHSDVKYLMQNTLEEKMSVLDVRAEAKLSILWGLITITGSGKYFNDKKQTTQSVKVSLANLVKTEYERINLSGVDERKFIDLDILRIIDATHVVIGIQWGGNVFVSVEDTNSENRDEQLVQGSLGGQLNILMNSISLNGNVSLGSEEISEYGKFSFELYGDILTEETPTTLVDAVKLMKLSSSKLTEGNSGKGKPMSYSLLPIDIFRQLLTVEAEVNAILNSIDSVTIHSCVRFFEELEVVERKIGDLELNRKIFEKYIVKEKLDSILSVVNEYHLYKTTLTHELGGLMTSVRSGNESGASLLNTLEAAAQNKLSPRNIDFEEFFSVETEFRFLRLLNKMDVTILTKDQSFEEFMSENFNVKVYAFFYTIDYATLLEKPMHVFMSIVEQRESFDPNGIFVAIKSDITRERERNTYFNFNEPTRLRVYKNGVCLVDNYGDDSIINEVPTGFVYVQYPGMSAPGDIWPQFKWQSITENFANGFFRAEGSESVAFGDGEQKDNLRGVTDCEFFRSFASAGSEFVVEDNTPTSTFLAFSAGNGTILITTCNKQGGEIRPRNYAIRIWKRIS